LTQLPLQHRDPGSGTGVSAVRRWPWEMAAGSRREGTSPPLPDQPNSTRVQCPPPSTMHLQINSGTLHLSVTSAGQQCRPPQQTMGLQRRRRAIHRQARLIDAALARTAGNAIFPMLAAVLGSRPTEPRYAVWRQAAALVGGFRIAVARLFRIGTARQVRTGHTCEAVIPTGVIGHLAKHQAVHFIDTAAGAKARETLAESRKVTPQPRRAVPMRRAGNTEVWQVRRRWLRCPAAAVASPFGPVERPPAATSSVAMAERRDCASRRRRSSNCEPSIARSPGRT